MMTAVRQTVTVGAGGRLELVAPDLPAGTVADVIVLVSPPTQASVGPQAATANQIVERLALLKRYQELAALTPEAAAAWALEVRRERESWPAQGEPLK